MDERNTENNSAPRSILTRNTSVHGIFQAGSKIGLAVFRISDAKASSTRLGRPVSV